MFNHDWDMVYEQQFPNGAIALLQGTIEVLKKNKILEKIVGPGLIGIETILKNKRSQYQLRIKAGSKIVFLGKFQLKRYNYFAKEIEEKSQ